MSFFYSQYTSRKGSGRGSQSRLQAHPSAGDSAPDPSPPPQPILKNYQHPPQINPITGLRAPAAGRLVKAKPTTWRRYRPLKPPVRKRKVVHFKSVEVKPFHFDWACADDVFFTRAELTSMGQRRFEDAAALRRRRQKADAGGDDEGGDAAQGGIARSHSIDDDVGATATARPQDAAALLAMAFEDDNADEDASIRGIEHFVYPALQQEMIRRKKQVQREVLEFARSNKLDPQGWRLAEHSRTLSQWARNVAMEKGVKYCISNAACDPEQVLTKHEAARFQKSQDDLDQLTRAIQGSALQVSASFGHERGTAGGAPSFVAGPVASGDGARDAATDAKTGGEEGEERLLQPPGAATSEG